MASLKFSFVVQVSGVKNYTMGKLDSVKRYGVEKLTSALDTPYGKAVVECVDGLLDNTEKYVDYYLPEEDGKLNVLETLGKVTYSMILYPAGFFLQLQNRETFFLQKRKVRKIQKRKRPTP